MRAGRGAALVFLLLLGGCASALKTPPDLLELAGGGKPPPPHQVDTLLREAGRKYGQRTREAVRRAADLYLEAAAADATRAEGLMGAVRARAWLIDHEPKGEVRKRDAVSAVQSAQWCARIAPEDARCSYWLAVAMGLQARERKTTGMDALPRIRKAFHAAADAVPDYERGGPDRALAIFYVRAPGWPSGPGDPDTALVHARKAIGIDPDFVPNQLALAEALKAVEDRKASREAYRRALEAARAEEARGTPDARDWACEAAKALGKPCSG